MTDLVTEIAQIDVLSGREAEFEAAVAEAVPLFRTSPGCRSLELLRSIESPSRYRLVVEWNRIEDHTVTFRQSDNFQRWRALVGAFFASPPAVEHSLRTIKGF